MSNDKHMQVSRSTSVGPNIARSTPLTSRVMLGCFRRAGLWERGLVPLSDSCGEAVTGMGRSSAECVFIRVPFHLDPDVHR